MRQRLDDDRLPWNVVGDMGGAAVPGRRVRRGDGAGMPAPHPGSAACARGRRSACCGRAGCCSRSTRTRSVPESPGRWPVEGFAHEFRVSTRWLAGQMGAAGFAVEETVTRNLTMRAVAKVVRSPSLRLYHAGDAVHRAPRVVPGLESLGEVGHDPGPQAGVSALDDTFLALLACPQLQGAARARGRRRRARVPGMPARLSGARRRPGAAAGRGCSPSRRQSPSRLPDAARFLAGVSALSASAPRAAAEPPPGGGAIHRPHGRRYLAAGSGARCPL